MAVRMLSPVMMSMLNLAFWRLLMFLSVSSLRGELQMKNPQKFKLLYTFSLWSY